MGKLDKATRFPIYWINWAFLGLILISAPYVASMDFGSVQIVARRTAQSLALGGFALGLLANFLGATTLFARRARLRKICWQWCLIHAVFLAVVTLVMLGLIRFDWLREWLQQVTQSLRR